jgi:hypothetical protein
MSALIHVPQPLGIGQIATHCYVTTDVSAGDTSTWMARSFHFARDSVVAVKVAFGNWYVAANDGGEVNNGSAATKSASVEYPSGTMHRLYFGGATSISAANGATVWSDWCPVSIPRNAKFFVRQRHTGTGAGGFSYTTVPIGNTSAGDALDNTATDTTMSGTVTDGFGGGAWLSPLAIVARTTRGSLIIFGDSHQAGLQETVASAVGDMGTVARAAGPYLGYLGTGVSGESAAGFLASCTKRIALARYFSHLMLAHGTNDILVGTSAATTLASNRSIAALLPNKPYLLATLPPNGSDTGHNTARTAYNTSVRDDRCWEIDAYVTTTFGGSTWIAGYSTDGVHANSTGASALVGTQDPGKVSIGGQGLRLPRV